MLNEFGLAGPDAKFVVTPGGREAVRQKEAASTVEDLEPYTGEECTMLHSYGRDPVKSGKLDFSESERAIHGTHAADSVMMEDGWMRNESGPWSKKLFGAMGMPTLPVDKFKRVIVRDVDGQQLVGDLWWNGSIAERVMRRAFMTPKNLDVGLESGSIEVTNCECENVWDEQGMVGADATQYRAITTRLTFLPIGRPDLQHACKEASRNIAMPVNQDWNALTRLQDTCWDSFEWCLITRGKLCAVLCDSTWIQTGPAARR